MDIKTYKFLCPHCKGHRVEEVVTDAAVVSEIAIIHEDGELDYGEQTTDDGYVSQYQCMNCGFIVGENEDGPITDQLDFVEWVKKNCPQD
jgi:rubredoxin